MSDLPSHDDVRNSGTGDWVDQAMRVQERKNRQLSSLLGDDAEALRQKKAELAGIFGGSTPVIEDDPDRPPDLFASEREQVRQQKATLAGLFGEEQQARQKENEELLGMFGFEQKPKSKKRK